MTRWLYDWLLAWWGKQKKYIVPLLERCKQQVWDEALYKTNRCHLLEGDVQVTRARLLADTEPNTAAQVRALPVTNLDFTWTLDVVQWTTTTAGWRWLCALERWLPNRIPASSANNLSTIWVATDSHETRALLLAVFNDDRQHQ